MSQQNNAAASVIPTQDNVQVADHKVKDTAYHVLSVAWVNPERLKVYVDIEELGVCVESLFEFDISTHDHLNRIAMVSYSKSAGLWSDCRIGIAGRDKQGDWYAIRLSDIRLLADNLRVNRHSNRANRDYLNYCQLLQYHKELH